MPFVDPNYWLLYVPESFEPPELTAIVPAIIDRGVLCRDARIALAVADLYHREHLDDRVVFVADLTAWLAAEKDATWDGLDVDIYDAMAEFDEHVPNLGLSADPIAIAVAIRGRAKFDVHLPGYPVIDAADHDEAVRADILRVITAYVEERRSGRGPAAVSGVAGRP